MTEAAFLLDDVPEDFSLPVACNRRVLMLRLSVVWADVLAAVGARRTVVRLLPDHRTENWSYR